MNFDDEKRIQIILYFITKLGKISKLHLIKLIFFADKYFLMRFGKSITGDKHCALPQGPICSETLDIINHNEFYSQEVLNVFDSFLNFDNNRWVSLKSEVNASELVYDNLSKLEKDVLNFVIKSFKDIDVVDYSHRMDEWKQFAVNGKVTGAHHIEDKNIISFDPEEILSKGVDETSLQYALLKLAGDY